MAVRNLPKVKKWVRFPSLAHKNRTGKIFSSRLKYKTYLMNKLNIGWFTTGAGEAASQLFDVVYKAIRRGEIKAEISFAFFNRALGESKKTDRFINKVKKLGIPVVAFSFRKFLPGLRKKDLRQWRKKYDLEIYKRTKNFKADIIMLAGYMLILDKDLCRKYTMLNLHPALPNGPTGNWKKVTREIIEGRKKEHGVMIHITTEKLDRGPVVTYCKFRVNRFNFWEIRKKDVRYELPLIKKTLKLIASGDIKIKNKKVFLKGKPCPNGCELKIKPR